MEFIQKPDTLTFAATMPNFIVGGVYEGAIVTLLKGNDTLQSESMFSTGQRLVIDLKDVINNSLRVDMPTPPIYHQKEAMGLFTLKVESGNDSLEYSFNAIRGGYEGFKIPTRYDAIEKLYTFQPVTKIITTESPEWLTFFINLNSLRVRFRFYLPHGELTATAYIDNVLSSTDAVGLYAIDCSYSQACELAIPAGGYGFAYYDVDLVASDDTIVSPTQRYIVTQATDSHRYYLFENTLGGIDTLICSGNIKKRVSLSSEVTVSNDIKDDSTNTHSLSFEQTVGIFSSDIELMWFRDFIISSQRYEVENDSLYRIIIEEADSEINLADADVVTFTFRRATEDKYSGFIRQRQELPMGLIFEGPDDVDFF